jgi:FAD/FMN-containing dehydrogenase
MKRYESWGRYPKARQEVRRIYWQTDGLGETNLSMLPYGLGRSYGDCCLNDSGMLLDTTGLDRFLSFDTSEGLLRCEAGVTLAGILELIVPKGWFLPVTPGTKYVTVGGAIANDVHGKNHHRSGTFGSHITKFEILRSNGERIPCSPSEHPDLFASTIGGLGLTGLILWAEFRLKRISTAFLSVETIRFGNLDEFYRQSEESDEGYEYTVAWVDSLSKGASLGRGLFFRGNHTDHVGDNPLRPGKPGRISVPLDAPGFLLNRYSIKLFNEIYYHKQAGRSFQPAVHYDPFFYPLDAVDHWNRLYGKRGFFQYQCVLPHNGGRSAARDILKNIADTGLGSFLAVMKICGDIKSPGMMSFPKKGVTIALDFPNGGRKTFELMDRLDDIVRHARGAVYPAKDARMSPESFQSYFPQWKEFTKYVDPKFSSSFWRRVTKVVEEWTP